MGRRRAKALGYGYEARLRGLNQATFVAFVPVACPFRGQAGVSIASTAYLLQMRRGGFSVL